MHTTTTLIFAVLATVCVRSDHNDPLISVAEAQLAGIHSGQYKVDPYITAAIELQSMDRISALTRLHKMAQESRFGTQTIVLCRMLFAKRPRTKFRGAMLGSPFVLGRTAPTNWPLEPIHLVDGVPFLITLGGLLAGTPESDEAYLRYCEKNCDWSTFKFAPITAQQKQVALQKLLAARIWKTQLDPYERKFLSDQIQ